MQRQALLCLLIAASLVNGRRIELTSGSRLVVINDDGSSELLLDTEHGLESEGTDCGSQDGVELCRRWGDITYHVKPRGLCYDVQLASDDPNDTLKGCMNQTGHWYGGPEQFHQYWPVEKEVLADYSYVTKQQDNQGIAEPYWVSSAGDYVYVLSVTPLFVDQNNLEQGMLCFLAKNAPPYSYERGRVVLVYAVCKADNARVAHLEAAPTMLGTPTGLPDERMVRHPIWSTWAKYKADINEEVIIDFANQIIQYGFQNSQLEIDDKWETCYGSLTFDTKRFPDIKSLTDRLKAKGFRVTLWIHPFINLDCDPHHSEALENGYFVKDKTGNTASVWWNGNASVIDFTNQNAVNWWVDRLKKLQADAGIDSFKFDAGETSWMPQVPELSGPIAAQPGTFTAMYVEAVAKFGPMVEVRVGQHTQHLPIFVRMLDKDSKWDFRNGLPTLITTLLQMNMVGYTFVLPDMVGGNGYGDVVTKELFIRWLQANVFMPAIQYSYVPWDYDLETIDICKKYTELHANYTDKIVAAMQKCVDDGSPVNAPVWWIDPEDSEAQAIDDEYLLGEDILVAPVIKEGAVKRDIYLPAGTWRDQLRPDSPLISGRTWLRDYPAALHELPYFTREKSA